MQPRDSRKSLSRRRHSAADSFDTAEGARKARKTDQPQPPSMAGHSWGEQSPLEKADPKLRFHCRK